jgi:hypothetical protein
VAADAVGYGKGTDYQQMSVQQHLVEVLNTAAEAANLHRITWDRQQAGDAELAVLPEDEPEAVVVDLFVRQLDVALARHNLLLRPEVRLRLKVAIHFGRFTPGHNGFAGPGPVEVSRLLNSRQLRAAMIAVPAANLAMMVSSSIYRDTIEPLHTTLRPAEFHPVHIIEKEFEADAWLWIPGLPYLTASGLPLFEGVLQGGERPRLDHA